MNDLFAESRCVWPDVPLRLGACSWTAKGWEKVFYQRAKRPTDFIGEYSERYATVEIDASFYAVPREDTVRHWYDSTTKGFVFAAKAPRIITHDKFLEGCGGDLQHFLDTISVLREKMGPLLFQFPYFAKSHGVDLNEFLRRLVPFLHLLPKDGFQFALEVRNKAWVCPPLCDLLGDHNIALALIDHPWMAPCDQLFRNKSIITAPFTYIRWLGDRKGIEKLTTTWDKPVIDRTRDLDHWVPHIKDLLEQQVRISGFVNNHYSGHAPADIDHLQTALEAPK